MLKNNAFITDLHLVATLKMRRKTSLYWEWLTGDYNVQV